MKKVLIALDYDASAQNIAEAGYAIAKSLEAETFLLHVIADPVYYSSFNSSSVMGYDGLNNLDMLLLNNIDTVGALKKVAEEYLVKSKEHLGDEKIQTIIKEGDYAESILDASTEIGADVIVIGSHGRRGLDKILSGSVAEEVLHKTLVPLYVIPTKNFEEKKG